MRRVLVRKAVEVIGPDAWVVDDTGFKKDGDSSPGVARQYSGTLGKIGNCQIAVSIHAATDAASCPLDWRLFIPETWDDICADTNEQAEAIMARRTKAQIPQTQRHRTKWAMALEMIDELGVWGRRPRVMVGDAGYGEITAFRSGLTERQIPYMVAVKAATTAYPECVTIGVADYAGKGPRSSQPRYLDTPKSLKDLVTDACKGAAGRKLLHQVTWRHGTKTSTTNRLASMTSRFIALRVRAANRDIPRADDGSLPTEWLLAEWPQGATAPTDYWFSTLPRNNSVERTGPDRKNSVADRTRLPGTENRARLGPLRRPHLRRLAPPCDPRHRRSPVHHHPETHPPKSAWGSLSLYGILREPQHLAAARTGYCPHCHQRAGPT